MMQRIPHSDKIGSTVQDPAEYYEQHKKHAQVQFKPFFRQIHKLDIKGHCLEIGSGPGILASMMARAFPEIRIKAVELSPEMIDLGKKHVKEMGTENRIEFIQSNVEDEAFMLSLGQFDLVYSTFSLHHWKNPEQALRLMYNATDKNGTLMIFDFKRVWWLYYYPKHTGFMGPVRASYLPKEMRRMFKNIGIQNFKIRTPFPYFWQIIMIQK